MSNAVSASGLALIQRYEGFRVVPEPLPDGNWLVGYGHVRIGQAGPAMTQTEAADLLALDLAPVERLVNALVSRPLTQCQFDALVSFAFSIGDDAFAGSQVLRRVNAGDFLAAACAMDAWRKADVGGEVDIVDALVCRRAAEKALFLQDLPVAVSASALMRAKLDHAAAILGAPVRAAAAAGAGAARAPTSFVETNVVQLVRTRVEAPKFEPTARLTEILKSEPATEALLLTQVANDLGSDDEELEIATAHAKPVARSLDDVREATRRNYEAQQAKAQSRRGFAWFKRAPAAAAEAEAVEPLVDRRIRAMRGKKAKRNTPAVQRLSFVSAEHLGLAALLLFGLGLISLGASLVFKGSGEMVEFVAAAAVIAPGLAATIVAAYGLWRAPRYMTA